MNAAVLAKAQQPGAPSRLIRPGTVQVLGSTGTVYTVAIGERVSCDCKAGSFGRNCRHQRAAIEGWPAFWQAPMRLRQVSEQPKRKACKCDLYGPDACNGNCK